MAITISGSTLTFNDGSTQTTAATGASTTAGAVGTYTIACSTSTKVAGGVYAVGTTVAGSTLIAYESQYYAWSGTLGGLYLYNQYWQASAREDINSVNCGYTGTWRLMTRLTIGSGGGFDTIGVVALYIRIS